MLVRRDHRADRRVSRGHAFGDGDDVGLVTVAIGREVIAEPAERADGFVGDEQHAVAVANLPHALEIARRRRETAARVLHRLEVNGGNRLGTFAKDRALDLIRSPAAERDEVVAMLRRAIEVGVRNAYRARHQRLEDVLDSGQAGDRERAHRRSVVGDVSADHLVPARLTDRAEVLASKLPCRFDSFRAAGGEEDPVQVAGG